MQVAKAVAVADLFEQFHGFHRRQFVPIFIGQPTGRAPAFQLGAIFHQRQLARVHGQPVAPVMVMGEGGLESCEFLRLVAQHHAATGGQRSGGQFAEALQRMKIQTQDGRRISGR